MNKSYFYRQNQARSNTFKLVFIYIIGLFIVPLLVNCLYYFFVDNNLPIDTHVKYYGITIAICAIPVLMGSVAFYFKNSGPGYKTAERIGAFPIDDYEPNSNLIQLNNIVEEISFASGLKKPSIYVLENPTINAFAAGTSIDNAIVCVNTGALDQLSREELSGIIAHEYSHIANNDISINIKIGTMIAGFSALSILGSGLMRSVGRRRNSSKNAGGVILVGLVLYLLGNIWKFYSIIISAALSRQREFLADATAVAYTRDDSLAKALEKILYSKIPNSKIGDEAMNHMFFCNTKKASFFDTHPKLETRIERVKEMCFTKGYGKHTDQ